MTVFKGISKEYNLKKTMMKYSQHAPLFVILKRGCSLVIHVLTFESLKVNVCTIEEQPPSEMTEECTCWLYFNLVIFRYTYFDP